MGVRGRVGAVKMGAQLGAALVVSLSLPVEQAGASERAEVTVMTQNLYLGSSLQPALAAETPAQFVGAVALIYSTMLFTDFPGAGWALGRHDRRGAARHHRAAGGVELGGHDDTDARRRDAAEP